MVVNFEHKKIENQLKRFNETGEIPGCLYAGNIPASHQSTSLHWAKMLLVIESDNAYKDLMKSIQCTYSEFSFPYTMSKYKKGLCPIETLYEELQLALFVENKSKFDKWIIEVCITNCVRIIEKLSNSITSIDAYIKKYRQAPCLPVLQIMLKKYTKYYNGFTLLKRSYL